MINKIHYIILGVFYLQESCQRLFFVWLMTAHGRLARADIYRRLFFHTKLV